MRETLQNTNGKQFHAVSLSGGKDSTNIIFPIWRKLVQVAVLKKDYVIWLDVG